MRLFSTLALALSCTAFASAGLDDAPDAQTRHNQLLKDIRLCDESFKASLENSVAPLKESYAQAYGTLDYCILKWIEATEFQALSHYKVSLPTDAPADKRTPEELHVAIQEHLAMAESAFNELQAAVNRIEAGHRNHNELAIDAVLAHVKQSQPQLDSAWLEYLDNSLQEMRISGSGMALILQVNQRVLHDYREYFNNLCAAVRLDMSAFMFDNDGNTTNLRDRILERIAMEKKKFEAAIKQNFTRQWYQMTELACYNLNRHVEAKLSAILYPIGN